jgi:serralysin
VSGTVGIACSAALLSASASPTNAFVAADRWASTATSGAAVQGRPVTLTWSLVPDKTPIPEREPSNLVAMLDHLFGVVASEGDLTHRPWFPAISSAFERWSELGGVTFEFEPYDDGAALNVTAGALGVRGDVRLAASRGDGFGNTLASSQYPDSGDIVLDRDEGPRFANGAENYLRLRNALMHEIGHALGLDHVLSSDADFLMEPSLSVSFDGPQIDDIRGLHYLYGDALERSHGGAGNGSAALASPLGLLPSGEVVRRGADAGEGTEVIPQATDFLSISSRFDLDFFSIDVAGPGRLDVEVVARAGRYRQSAMGQPEVLVEANASSPLSVALYDAKNMLLHTAGPSWGGSRLDDVFLPMAGRYFIQVSGVRERVQLYELDVRVRGAHLPEPASATLAAGLLCATSLLRRSFLTEKEVRDIVGVPQKQ